MGPGYKSFFESVEGHSTLRTTDWVAVEGIVSLAEA